MGPAGRADSGRRHPEGRGGGGGDRAAVMTPLPLLDVWACTEGLYAGVPLPPSPGTEGGPGGHAAGGGAAEAGGPEAEAGPAAAAVPPQIPGDVLVLILSHLSQHRDILRASLVSRQWRAANAKANRHREALAFAHSQASEAEICRLVRTAVNLRRLDLWCRPITDDGIEQLIAAGLPKGLEKLSLWGCPITDAGASALLRHHPGSERLLHLNLGATQISDYTLQRIGEHCGGLRVLNLWGCRRISKAVLEGVLRKLTGLQKVHLAMVEIDLDAALAAQHPGVQSA